MKGTKQRNRQLLKRVSKTRISTPGRRPTIMIEGRTSRIFQNLKTLIRSFQLNNQIRWLKLNHMEIKKESLKKERCQLVVTLKQLIGLRTIQRRQRQIKEELQHLEKAQLNHTLQFKNIMLESQLLPKICRYTERKIFWKLTSLLDTNLK